MEHLAASALSFLMVLAGAWDVLSRRIPNLLNLSIALLFLSMAIAAGLGWAVIVSNFTTGLLVLILCFVFVHLGSLGGGDAKLLAAVSLWFGLSELVLFLVMTALAGGVLAAAMAVKPLFASPASLVLQKRSVPYGAAIATGAILAAPDTWWGPAVPFWSLLTTH